jgi:hypothetical protein
MKRHLLIQLIIIFFASNSMAQKLIYETEDSTKVMQLLSNAPSLSRTNEYMMYFGNKLKGVPYVAKTLEVGNKENLIVNLRGLDCTTFTENVLALSLCMKNEKKTFLDFVNYLRMIRYRDGHISYDSRLHYFTSWIENNTKNEYVYEDDPSSLSNSLYKGTQHLNIDFMTRHVNLYPSLIRDSSMVMKVRETEKKLTGKTFRYIPKAMLRNYGLLKKYVRSGDIIAILTNKKGLDTSHIGIASWHSDGTLHLLNASQIHKKVVDEPMSIYTYMQKHPSQIGIRVIHVN